MYQLVIVAFLINGNMAATLRQQHLFETKQQCDEFLQKHTTEIDEIMHTLAGEKEGLVILPECRPFSDAVEGDDI